MQFQSRPQFTNYVGLHRLWIIMLQTKMNGLNSKCVQVWRNTIVKEKYDDCLSTCWCGKWSSVIACCEFFKRRRISLNTTCIADDGLTDNDDFPIRRPFTESQLQHNPGLEAYNQTSHKYRQFNWNVE